MSAAVVSFASAQISGTLEKAEALIDACRPRQALALADRCLQRRPLSPDDQARLRLVRSLALWLAGGRSAGRELKKATDLVTSEAVAQSARQAAALFAWRRMDFTSAWRELRGAGAAQPCPPSARGAWLEAGLRKDEGRLTEALECLDSGIAAAEREGRPGWRARLLGERAGVFATQGRWSEARRDALASREVFRQLSDHRELTVAGLAHAAIDLALGDLAEARVGIERARALLQLDRSDPRAQADVMLLHSDLQLAAGATEEAVASASQALTLFSAARDRRGQCLAHVRHAHALVSAGRPAEALSEARRAVRAGGETRTQVQAWAELVLGRVLLRLDAGQASAHFDRAEERAGERLDLRHLARLGSALARGEGRQSARLREALDGLVAWGDRRILAFGVADVRDLIGAITAVAGAPEVSPPELAIASLRERALVDAAVALARPGDWPSRWAAAMRALRPVAAWSRAALVGPLGLELRPDLDAPRRLEADDFLFAMARGLAAPTRVELADHGGAAEHPVRLLHGLRSAALAPLPDGGALCLAFRGPTDERHVALVAEAALLLAPHLRAADSLAMPQACVKPFPDIVGCCRAMQALFEEMARVAASEVFVHVAGETGTGKGKVAQALHGRSRRRNGPFVAVNASSVSDELFEAEMFGHARGAFTGAVAAREGYVAEAQGGTLFIDEVADLSPRAQAKLLRLLQEREYRRVGESTLRKANVRVVTAANVDLEESVAKGSFREDLMYRIAVVTLRLPPLRERGDDLILLARHFLRAAATRDGRAAPPLPASLSETLLRYGWPGNVRELENEMARLVALSGGEALNPALLSARLRGDRGADRQSVCLREGLLGFERDFLKAALVRNRSNRTRTATEVGITRQALLAKMTRLGLV